MRDTCIGCAERHVNCHSTCEKFIKQSEARKERKAQIDIAKKNFYEPIALAKNSAMKIDKKNRRR